MCLYVRNGIGQDDTGRQETRGIVQQTENTMFTNVVVVGPYGRQQACWNEEQTENRFLFVLAACFLDRQAISFCSRSRLAVEPTHPPTNRPVLEVRGGQAALHQVPEVANDAQGHGGVIPAHFEGEHAHRSA